MKKGIYRYSCNEHPYDSGTITIEVSETDKSYIFRLIENSCRYSPAHIDMMFEKSNRVVIRKEKSPHAIIDGKDYFVIYPNRAGIPFLFEFMANNAELARKGN